MNIYDNEINITEIAIACLVKKGTGTLVHKNRSFHGLVIEKDGLRNYIFHGGHTLAADMHSVVFLPKGSSYNVDTSVLGDCYCINFDVDCQEVMYERKLAVSDRQKMLHLFEKAEELWKNKTCGYILKIKSILFDIFYQLQVSEKNAIPERYSILTDGIDYIEKNYSSPDVSVAHAAKICNITPVYFRKLFNELYEMPPLRYIIEKRIQLARELLESKMYTVKDISELCGYTDCCIFSREFKKQEKISPKKYMLKEE